MKKTLIVVPVLIFSFFFSLNVYQKRQTKKTGIGLVNFTRALASTVLTGNASFNSAEDKANFIRYNYFTVNGPSDDYTLASGSTGYMGTINSILGSEGLGGVLGSLGYASCDAIPTSGTSSSGDYSVTFSTGSKTIPGHFAQNAGATLEKKVEASYQNQHFLNIELTCSASGTLTSGYMIMYHAELTLGMTFESYFQMDTSTDQNYIDLYLDAPSDSMKMVLRFYSTDGVSYKLYNIFTAATSNSGLAINGEASGLTNMNILYTTDLTSSVAAANVYDITGISTTFSNYASSNCIDMAVNSDDSGCNSLTSPGTITIGDTVYDFTMTDISSVIAPTL